MKKIQGRFREKKHLCVSQNPAQAAVLPGGIGEGTGVVSCTVAATAGVKRYLGQMQWLFDLMPQGKSSDQEYWLIDARVVASDCGSLQRFWGTRVMPDRWLAQNGGWLLSARHPVFGVVGQELNVEKSVPLADSIACVRLLGGWKGAWTSEPQEQDVVYKDNDGSLCYRWHLLRERLDGIVTNGLTPLIVLDNVPYCFVETGQESTYGQVMGPSDLDGWGQFVESLCYELINLYGMDTVNHWRFRIGTEPNMPGHWQDTQENYAKSYDYASAAIKRVLPKAKVGPGNFNAPLAGNRFNLEQLMDHFAVGTNYATGEKGSPVDFLGMSVYGMDHVPGFGIQHPYASGWGYSPYMMKLAARTLHDLRGRLGADETVPLEFMEFGTLFNEAGVVSSEPGAFGAAWTCQAFLVALAEGIQRIFHWSTYESRGNAALLFGNGWVMAMLEQLVGGKAQVLTAHAGLGAALGTDLMALKVEKEDTTFVIAAFNPNRSVKGCESVQLRLPDSGYDLNRITVQELNETNCVYDIVYRKLLDAGYLRAPINSIRAMASEEGVHLIDGNMDDCLQQQQRTFAAKPFAGEVSRVDGLSCLSFSVSVPSVTLVHIPVGSPDED